MMPSIILGLNTLYFSKTARCCLKRAAEAALREWIQSHPAEREKLLRLFSSLELSYSGRRETNHALAYFGEAFINGPELVQLALEILNFDFEAEEKQVVTRIKKLLEKYCLHAQRISGKSRQEVSACHV